MVVFLFHSFLAPLGGLEGLDAMLYGRLSSQKSLFFSKQLRQLVERCSKMIRNELLYCLRLFCIVLLSFLIE